MKHLITLIALFFVLGAQAQLNSKPSEFKKGIYTPFLQIDEKTTAERDAMVIPAGTSRMIYNVDTNVYNYYNGTIWSEFSTAPKYVFEKELTDAENNINVGFTLESTTVVYYNGWAIPSALWSGTGTQVLNLSLDTKQYDKLKVKN